MNAKVHPCRQVNQDGVIDASHSGWDAAVTDGCFATCISAQSASARRFLTKSWSCGFYPGQHRSGMAARFDEACTALGRLELTIS
jgi:hypothetical protein